MNKKYQEIFCPVVNHNVIVNKAGGKGEKAPQCLNSHICQANGGCKNNRFTGK